MFKNAKERQTKDKMDEVDARQEVMDAVFSQTADMDNANQQASPEQSDDSDA